MPSYSIVLSKNTIAQLQARPRSAAKPSLIKDILEDTGTLVKMLDHYCVDDLGTVRDDWFMIHPDTISFGRKLKGLLMIRFDETADYGCVDKMFKKEHESEIEFAIDLNSELIYFDVPISSRTAYYYSASG